MQSYTGHFNCSRLSSQLLPIRVVLTVFLYIISVLTEIDLELHSKKLITLLALVTAHRVQTLSLIFIQNIVVNNDNICIYIPDIIKTTRLGSKQPNLIIPFYTIKLEICPANTLLCYLEKTKTLRGEVKNLFISFKKPFRKVTSQTLSRWIKDILFESGIDTSVFSAHSTRHASTSNVCQLYRPY